MTKTLQFVLIMLTFTSIVLADERPPQQHRGPAPVITLPESPLPFMRLSDPELDGAKGLIVRYQPSSAVYLGSGVNATDLTDIKDRPLVLTPLKRVGWESGDVVRIPRVTDGFQTDTGARQVSFTAELVHDRKELYTALNTSMSAEADSWFASGSASMSLAVSNSFSSESVKLVIKASCDYGRYALERIAMTDDAKAIATNSDLFYKRYGTHVAIMEDRFVEFAAVITIQAENDDAALSLRTSMEGDMDLFIVSGSVSGNMSTDVKTKIQNSHVTFELYSIGGEGIKNLGDALDATRPVDAKEPLSALAKLDAAKNAVKKYMLSFSPDTAPARMYWCYPLAPLRRSDEKVRDLQTIIATRERAAEGIIELQQIVDNGLPEANNPKANVSTKDARSCVDPAVRQRAANMLSYFRCTFLMSRGAFAPEPAGRDFDKALKDHREILRVSGRAAPVMHSSQAAPSPNPAAAPSNICPEPSWGGYTLRDEWNLWLEGVAEFPFVERAKAVAQGRKPIDFLGEEISDLVKYKAKKNFELR